MVSFTLKPAPPLTPPTHMHFPRRPVTFNQLPVADEGLYVAVRLGGHHRPRESEYTDCALLSDSISISHGGKNKIKAPGRYFTPKYHPQMETGQQSDGKKDGIF